MDYKLEHFKKFPDKRGELIVFLKSSELPKSRKKFGQIYFVTFNKKKVVRGNHYHKKWREWFGIVAGILEVKLRDMKTGEEVELTLNSKNYQYIRLEIGPNIAHAFRSNSSYAALLNYADSEWAASDSLKYKLL